MAKLALKAPPTFKGKVKIPVAGGAPVEVVFDFKHRTREQLDGHIAEARDKPGASIDDEVEAVMKVATGWDLDEPFNAENVKELLNNYHRASWAIGTGYISELMQAREGN